MPTPSSLLRAHLRRARCSMVVALGTICLCLGASSVHADPSRQVAFLNEPVLLATDESVHPKFLQFGPLLVDDFIPAASGALSQVTWWGSPFAGPWFIAIFSEAPPPPADPLDLASIFAHAWVTYSGGADSPNCDSWGDDFTPPDICEYRFWPVGNVALEAGRTYWLLVANSEPGWFWAQGSDSPAVGSQQASARVLCPSADGPCDQWFDINGNLAFAFKVPEPGILLLLALAALMAVQARRPRSHT